MIFAISIEGEALKQLIEGRRLKGSLGLSADGQVNFNVWHQSPPESYTYIRLRHGRACVSDNRIRLHIDMERAEKVEPVNAIYNDMYDAVSFIREEIKPKIETKEDERKQPA